MDQKEKEEIEEMIENQVRSHAEYQERRRELKELTKKPTLPPQAVAVVYFLLILIIFLFGSAVAFMFM